MSQDKKAFQLLRVFVKDLSFECPAAAEVRPANSETEIRMYVSAEHQQRDADGLWDVTLRISINYRDKANDETLYLIDASQGGLFEISGVSTEERDRLLKAECRDAVYPFLRALFWSIGGHSGWKGLLLRPMEFDALYRHAEQSGEAATSTHPG